MNAGLDESVPRSVQTTEGPLTRSALLAVAAFCLLGCDGRAYFRHNSCLFAAQFVRDCMRNGETREQCDASLPRAFRDVPSDCLEANLDVLEQRRPEK